MSLADALNEYKNDSEQHNVSIIAIIDSYLRTRKDFYPFKAEISRNKLVGFHPSELYGACPRYLAFRFLHEKGFYNSNANANELDDIKNNNVILQRIWDTGHMLHFLIQYSYLPDYGIKFKAEVPVTSLYKKYLIAGTGDIVVEMQNGKEYLIDIKSMKGLLFNKLKTLDDVSSLYIGQTALYALGLKVKNSGILFWNKDTSELKEFFFSSEHERAKPILKKALQNATIGKNFLFGKKSVPILDECKNLEGKFKSCSYSSVCFSCKKIKDIDRITTDKFRLFKEQFDGEKESSNSRKEISKKTSSKESGRKKLIKRKPIKTKAVGKESEGKSNKLKEYESLRDVKEVKMAIASLPNINEPEYDISEYLNNVINLADASDRDLGKHLALFTSWQNYYNVKLKEAEIIKTVAEEQMKYFYILAIQSLSGTITEKKQLAFIDELYLASLAVYNTAKAKHSSIETSFLTCDRAYKAVSRIVKIREMQQ